MKNQTNVDPYVKWDNVLIKFGDIESIPMVKFFWDTIGIETSFALLGGYYYMGVVIPVNNTINVMDFTILSFQEAIEIYNKQYKKFPREMYVWDCNINNSEKEVIVYICSDEELKKYNRTKRYIGLTVNYENAMEVEEYEAMMKKENENAELIKQIEKTGKELAELKSKLNK